MDRFTAILVTLISLAFTALGAFLLTRADTPDDIVMGWMVSMFFGACAMVGVTQILPARMPKAAADGRIIIAPSRLRAAIFALAGLAFAFAGGVIFQQGLAHGFTAKMAIGSLGLPFGLACAIFSGRQVLSVKPMYILNPQGAESLRGVKWRLAWEDIAAIGLASIRNNKFLVFETRPDVPDPPGHLSSLNRRFGLPPYAISPGTSGIAFEPLADQVFALWEARNGPARPL
jgi:hypothetical protein